MNEQIRKLYEQAMEQNISNNSAWEELNPEKFAELIVRECADVLLKWKGEPFPFDEDLAASLIKEHFGVERSK